MKRVLQFENCLTVESRGISGGLCLMWKQEIDVYIRLFSHNHIDCSVSIQGRSWRFLGIYGCLETDYKKLTFDLIRRLSNHDDSPWI